MTPRWLIRLTGVRDARGVPVAYDRNAGVSEQRSRPSSKAVMQLMGRGRAWLAGSLTIGPLVALIIAALISRGEDKLGWFADAIPITLAAAFPAGLFLLAAASAQAGANEKANLGYCAQCGYELKGLPKADDGCTVCPECGAAWRRPS